MENSGSSVAGNSGGGKCENGSYENIESAQYTDEQVAIFETVYAQCPSPSASQRQQMKLDHHALKDIEDIQIIVWFQNRRSHEEQKKENNEVQSTRERLIAANSHLMEENVNLKKSVIELLHENDYLRWNRRMRNNQ